ncbi:hypothetical protein PUN28_003538 [Cardiocondyla obscurior]|uniref:Ribosomal protein eL8/eL30/eS12/Gadd45 domain-containing protein n=1 Tax=Cardiocondyla obscurior TaxID=286306 RepID=A0AAW2GNN2_9HYME
MTTPVLTKNQQRHSLSAKKGPVKRLRNILAQPHPNFWPVINVDQYPKLIKSLNMVLPSIQQTNNKISKAMLKNIPKKERVLARKKMLETVPPRPDILKFMIMGINAVTRALEKDNICCILLDANVEPPLIIKHVVTMAVNKKVPVLLLPILKITTLEKMGFAAAAFGLKQEIKQCPDNDCHSLYKLIAETFENFEPPDSLLPRLNLNEMFDKNATCEPKTTNTSCDTDLNIPTPEKPVITFTNVYKYRTSRNKRAFVPPTADKKTIQVSQISLNTSDEFIPLDKDSYPSSNKVEKHTEESNDIEKEQTFKKRKVIDNNADSIKHTKSHTLKRPRKDEPSYLSLKVKRIKGNEKRKTTKLAKKKR